MASTLDQYISIGKESTYGTAITPTRSFEATEDNWQREVEQLTSDGLRAGKHTQLDDRRRPIDLGANGSIGGAITKNGMGILLDGLLGATTGPTQSGATDAYETSFETTSSGPEESFTVQVVRVDSGGTKRAFDYAGAVATGFNFALDSGAELTYRIDYAAASEEEQASPTDAIYVADNEMWIYSDCSLKIDGTVSDSITSFSFDGDLALDTGRRFIRGDAARRKPIRSGSPAFSGTLSGEFAGLDLWEKFKDGDTFSIELVAEASAVIPSATLKESFTVKLAACRFDGSSPQASVDGLTTIDLPFTVVHDGTNSAVEILAVSTDSAL